MDKPHNHSASPGYETRDANIRGVFFFLVFLSLLLVATGLVSWGVFRYFAAQDAGPIPASPFADTRQLPSGPQLQVHAREDWLKYRERQEQSLETYDWENRGAGVVRIPIERAMELLVQKGLPVQNSSASQTGAVSVGNRSAQVEKSTPGAAGKKP